MRKAGLVNQRVQCVQQSVSFCPYGLAGMARAWATAQRVSARGNHTCQPQLDGSVSTGNVCHSSESLRTRISHTHGESAHTDITHTHSLRTWTSHTHGDDCSNCQRLPAPHLADDWILQTQRLLAYMAAGGASYAYMLTCAQASYDYMHHMLTCSHACMRHTLARVKQLHGHQQR